MLPSFARLLTALFRPGRPATWLAAAVVTLAVPAAPAHAQLLKKLKQAAAEKAAEAAGRKVLGDDKQDSTVAQPAAAERSAAAPARAASSATSSAPTRSSAPSKLEITPERIDLFLVAMEPFREVARQREAHAAAEKKVEDYNKCMAVASQKQAAAMMSGSYTGPTKAQQAEIDRLLDLSNALNQQMIAAMQSGDTVRVRVLTDSSVRTSTKAQALLNPYIAKTCGATPPAKPAPLDEHRLAKAALPRRIDGWTPTQFGLMRERLAIYLLWPEKASLTPEERAAVDAKRAGFQPYLAMWRDTGDWKGWYEIGAAWKD